MSLKNCSVVFRESPQGVYRDGQTVSGVINITQESPKKIFGLILEVIGEAKTVWKEKFGEGKSRKKETFEAHDIYFQSPPVLLTNAYPNKDGWVTLKKGLSSFNFYVCLPHLLPSSFEGHFGKIRYYVKVTVKRDDKHEKSISFPFTVTCTNDLNLNPTNRLPIRHELMKKYALFSANLGTLVMHIDIPASGYTPGEQIRIQCHVNNSGKVPIKQFIFSFERVVTYFSTSPCARKRIEKNKLVESAETGVHKEAESRFQVVLIVPTIPPSSLSKTSIINIEYALKVHLKLQGIFSDLKENIPITVGNVPLVMSISDVGPSSSSADVQLSSNLSNAPPQYHDSSDTSGLPTYEESELSNQMMQINAEKKIDEDDYFSSFLGS